MKRILLAFLTLALLPFCLWAVDLEFSGETSLDTAVLLPPADEEASIPMASLTQSFELNGYADFTGLYLNAGFSFDFLQMKLTPFVSEAYIDLYMGFLGIRAGMQKASWGVSEIQSAVDVITPSDLSNPADMSKEAIDALKVSMDLFPIAIDLYWIPVFTPSPLPADVLAMMALYGIEPKKPETKLENSEFGAKASAYTSVGDFSIYGYYGWEDTPTMEGKYERLTMVGASSAMPAGPVTLKSELAWYPDRDQVLSGSTGFEWIHDDLTLITEVYGQYSKSDDSLSGQIGAVLSYDLLDSELQLSLTGILEFEKWDGAAMLGASYNISDELKVSANVVYVFEGPEEKGTYGEYSDLDCVMLGATYSF